MVSQVWFLTLDCRTSDRAQIINRFGCSPDAQTFSEVSLQQVGQHSHCTSQSSTQQAVYQEIISRYKGLHPPVHTPKFKQQPPSWHLEVSSLRELLMTPHP